MNFAFNGSALAAGAEIEFGDAVITIPSLGSLMLSPEGGQGRAAVSNYFSQELKIGEAESKVAGRNIGAVTAFSVRHADAMIKLVEASALPIAYRFDAAVKTLKKAA